MFGVKRIKKIIESFLNIGQDPQAAISSAWGRVAASASTATQEDLALVDRLIGGVLQQAGEMKAKATTEAKQ
jgi:hypothetical protein